MKKTEHLAFVLEQAGPLSTLTRWEAACELRRLRAENESLRADAERYRWLRETSKKRPEFYSGDEAWMVSHEHGNGTGSNYFGEKIDAAIDAARKA